MRSERTSVVFINKEPKEHNYNTYSCSYVANPAK